MRMIFTALFLSLTASIAMAAETHYVAIHVDENDPQVMNLALNNAQNVSSYYAGIGDDVTIEIVTYGPGLNMLVAGTSPVEARISAMALEYENVTFAACANTHGKMVEKAGKDVPLLPEATVVPSGIVRLIELQEDGYTYIRP